MYRCCLKWWFPPPRVYPPPLSSLIPSPPPSPAPEELVGELPPLPFRQDSLSPMAAPLRACGERRGLLVLATCGPPHGYTTGSSGERNRQGLVRSGCVLTTSELSLLKDESVLVEKLSCASELSIREIWSVGAAEGRVWWGADLAFSFRGCRQWPASAVGTGGREAPWPGCRAAPRPP